MCPLPLKFKSILQQHFWVLLTLKDLQMPSGEEKEINVNMFLFLGGDWELTCLYPGIVRSNLG